MKPYPRTITTLAAAAAILSAPAWARTWTDTQGRQIEATLVDSNDTEVILQLDSNNEIFRLPLAKLSAEDLKFLGKKAPAVPDKGAPVPPKKELPPKPGPAAPAGELNFNAPWPQTVKFDADPQIQTITEDKETKKFIYESSNYRFICNVRLSQSVVKGFAVMFESSYNYCRALPLAISGGSKTDGKYLILLFETKEQYVEAGGPPTSAGVYMPGRNTVMVPLTSLGVRPVGSSYMLDRDKANGTLVHEITHQLTPGPYYSRGAMGWFSEGLAEYVTATPYRSGVFKVKSNFDDIVAYATGYGKDDTRGRALGEKISAPALKDFMLMSYGNFTGPRANFNYGFGLILTTYFLHLDGNGDAARAKKFLQALRAGKSGQEAIDVLLDGRSYEEMQDAISKAWKRKRVEIEWDGTSSMTDEEESDE
ncbi:SHD1 domain-containing protein [Luteolibacter luteus]|uniref:SLA1 homology domain-containing protein n=1 Tax=Luteolibacter luteus TaxID=2728835 RepID=A0A858RGR4_9BACT|nr:SHD1 domain-containing protein [Luteolibacter luteus]QJE96346.1 hypothetical protein HHL09_11305 [Luteolibacter luteus]